MNIITQAAKKKQAVVKFAKKNGKSAASRMYGVSLFKRVASFVSSVINEFIGVSTYGTRCEEHTEWCTDNHFSLA